uniref:Cyclin-dependent kinase 20 n=2 Tax=Clastoptera arizonana TaxID=38151 RepID=A0A1B6D7T3_9HEMI
MLTALGAVVHQVSRARHIFVVSSAVNVIKLGKMDQYQVKGRIGEGAHGLVLHGIHLLTKKVVALKKVLVKKVEEGIPNSVIREIKTLQELDHKYVIKLLDFFPHGVGYILVFEFMPSGLWEMLHDVENPITEAQAKTYMHMLLFGVSHLHKHNIMHRDLKPANLLISSVGELKIADLGLGRVMWAENDRPYSHQVATRWYRAPELLYGTKYYSSAIDMWAVGCILAELNNKTPLFPGDSDIEQLALVLQSLGTPTESTWKGVMTLPDYNKITFPLTKSQPWTSILPDANISTIHLASELLVYEPSKRLTADQALSHQYFSSSPLPCPLSSMPRPPQDHRQRLKIQEISTNETFSDMFKTLCSLVNE